MCWEFLIKHMESIDILKNEIRKTFYDEWKSHGFPCSVFIGKLNELAQNHKLGNKEVLIILDELIDTYEVARLDNMSFTGKPNGILVYEDLNNELKFEANLLRRKIMKFLKSKYEQDPTLIIDEQDVQSKFPDYTTVELFREIQFLKETYKIDASFTSGYTYAIILSKISWGHLKTEQDFIDTFPINNDESGKYVKVTHDILRDLHTNLDQILNTLKWDSVKSEFNEGNTRLSKKDYAGAVKDYYSALESAIKYKLTSSNVQFGSGASLKDLTSALEKSGLIPRNYKHVFDFVNSIRSPRSHGLGTSTEVVTIHEKEALLMKNHVSSLIVYLAQI